MNCPWCGSNAEAEFVDIGVGEQQVTAYACPDCHAVQIHPYFDDPALLSDEERGAGWHKPTNGD